MYRSVIFLLFCVGHVLPKSQQLVGRIVGGEVVSIKDFPYQVSVQIDNSHICGGSIISEKWVLTAAHCTNGVPMESFTVIVGSNDKNNGKRIKIKKVAQHEKFNEMNADYDYTLFELAEDLVFSDSIQSVKLIEEDDDIEDGNMCTVSGWGKTMNPNENNDLLRATQVPKINNEECNKIYEKNGGITKQMICAGNLLGGHGICNNDSGGPLVDSNKVLVGVVSWSEGCAVPIYPGVYSRVAAVRAWIKETSGV